MSFMVPIFILLIAGVAIMAYMLEQKRQEALVALASGLGLHYQRGKDRSLVAGYHAFDLFRRGRNQYAQSVFTGDYRNHRITAFDFHYETRSTDGKGHTQRHHHYFTCVICHLPKAFPELKVRPEGLFDKVASAVGWDDIDFESYEFSRTYHVSSRDKKFAYDFFHTRMSQFFLNHQGMVLEVDGSAMLLSTKGKINPERLEAHLDRLVAIRELVPQYIL